MKKYDFSRKARKEALREIFLFQKISLRDVFTFFLLLAKRTKRTFFCYFFACTKK